MTGIRKEKSVVTKEFLVAIEISKDSKKSYHDKVDRLKGKCLSRHTLEAEGHEKVVANRFSVATQYIPVVTRTRLLHQNSVVILSKSIATKSKKELREQVTTEDCILGQRPSTKTKNSTVTELSMSRQSDQFWPEF